MTDTQRALNRAMREADRQVAEMYKKVRARLVKEKDPSLIWAGGDLAEQLREEQPSR